MTVLAPYDVSVLSAAILAFVTFLILHLLLFRYSRPADVGPTLLRSLLAAVIVASVGAFAAGSQSSDAIPATLLAAVTSIGMLFLLVFHYMVWVFGMGESAIRIRILRELFERPQMRGTIEDIVSAYNADMIMQTRLTRLIDGGHLKRNGNAYSIGRRVLLGYAAAGEALKRILGADLLARGR